MKTILAAAALAVLSLPVWAGDCLSSYQCANSCPLAQEANLHRSYGSEAVVSSKLVRAEITATVKANLARI